MRSRKFERRMTVAVVILCYITFSHILQDAVRARYDSKHAHPDISKIKQYHEEDQPHHQKSSFKQQQFQYPVHDYSKNNVGINKPRRDEFQNELNFKSKYPSQVHKQFQESFENPEKPATTTSQPIQRLSKEEKLKVKLEIIRTCLSRNLKNSLNIWDTFQTDIKWCFHKAFPQSIDFLYFHSDTIFLQLHYSRSLENLVKHKHPFHRKSKTDWQQIHPCEFLAIGESSDIVLIDELASKYRGCEITGAGSDTGVKSRSFRHFGTYYQVALTDKSKTHQKSKPLIPTPKSNIIPKELYSFLIDDVRRPIIHFATMDVSGNEYRLLPYLTRNFHASETEKPLIPGENITNAETYPVNKISLNNPVFKQPSIVEEKQGYAERGQMNDNLEYEAPHVRRQRRDTGWAKLEDQTVKKLVPNKIDFQQSANNIPNNIPFQQPVRMANSHLNNMVYQRDIKIDNGGNIHNSATLSSKYNKQIDGITIQHKKPQTIFTQPVICQISVKLYKDTIKLAYMSEDIRDGLLIDLFTASPFLPMAVVPPDSEGNQRVLLVNAVDAACIKALEWGPQQGPTNDEMRLSGRPEPISTEFLVPKFSHRRPTSKLQDTEVNSVAN